MKVLSVDEIRARLDDRFRLLTGGNRAMPRHQTLHATMQWSHDLLTAPERRLFRRLAVFAGGCTLAAATDVSGDAADEYDTLERLTALHDKSLLIVDRDTHAQPRYRMLETVRQYAAERLNEAGEGDDMRTRHLLHYVALAERAAPGMEGPRQGEWFGSLWHEQENLLAAHAWCAHAAQGGEHALRLTASLWRYFPATAQYALGYRLAEAALGLARGGVECADGALALVAMSFCAMRMGQYDVAHSCAERSLAIARSLDDVESIARALSAVGSSLHAKGERLRAIASFQEACDRARAGEQTQISGFRAHWNCRSPSRTRQPRRGRAILRGVADAGTSARGRARDGDRAGQPGEPLDHERTAGSRTGGSPRKHGAQDGDEQQGSRRMPTGCRGGARGRVGPVTQRRRGSMARR